MKNGYHISYDGVARVCNKSGNQCQLGEHYDTMREARSVARERNKKNNTAPSIPSAPRERGPRIRFNPNMSESETVNINASIMANWFKSSLVPTDPERGFIGGNITSVPSKQEFIYEEWFADNEGVTYEWVSQTTERINSKAFKGRRYIHMYDEFKEILREYYKITKEEVS